MATPEDLQANADYIRMADQYVEVRSFAIQGKPKTALTILKNRYRVAQTTTIMPT